MTPAFLDAPSDCQTQEAIAQRLGRDGCGVEDGDAHHAAGTNLQLLVDAQLLEFLCQRRIRAGGHRELGGQLVGLS